MAQFVDPFLDQKSLFLEFTLEFAFADDLFGFRCAAFFFDFIGPVAYRDDFAVSTISG